MKTINAFNFIFSSLKALVKPEKIKLEKKIVKYKYVNKKRNHRILDNSVFLNKKRNHGVLHNRVFLKSISSVIFLCY